MNSPPSSKVYLIDSSDRDRAIGALLEQFDLGSGGTVALKANYNSDDPFPATTHPDTLRILAEHLTARSSKLVMAERSGMGDTSRVLKNRGVFDLARELGFELIDLENQGPGGWLDIQSDYLHWKRGFKIARVFQEADRIVQTCCLKTHRFGGHFTMSLKNSVGLVAAKSEEAGRDYMRELHSSPHQRLMIAEINAFYRVDLVVMDATTGFARGGPDRGDLITPNLILASSDRIAIDAVGVALLRYFGSTPEVMRGRIFEQEQISRAAELGIGARSAEEIELVPLDSRSQKAAEEIGNLLAAEA
jgi:uncharacterized protein (DUF362 family)